jgi:hypothetical protein
MRRLVIISIYIIFTLSSFAQNKIRTVEELINKDEPGWILVKEWIDKAKNNVEVLPNDTNKSNDALYKTQVTTRSPMGAIVYMTGGLLIDNGWIRILGSGNTKLNRNLPDWNKGKGYKELGETPNFLLIADDALGGFFILNGGGLGTDKGKIYYFSPDNLEYEPLDLTYSGFLNFCFNGDLEKFYKGYRWKNWRNDVQNLHGDSVFTFFPCLWSKEGKDIEKNTKSPIPIEEQYTINLYFRKQIGLDK